MAASAVPAGSVVRVAASAVPAAGFAAEATPIEAAEAGQIAAGATEAEATGAGPAHFAGGALAPRAE